MIEGETILSGAPNICPECHMKLKFQVLKSPAGWYIGTRCNCGPYSRETGYFQFQKQAEEAFEVWRTTGYLLKKRV